MVNIKSLFKNLLIRASFFSLFRILVIIKLILARRIFTYTIEIDQRKDFDHMTITLKHPRTHQAKTSKIGFSWTTLFFAFFPALFRGDFKWFFVQLVLAIMSIDISSIIFAFIYNKLYINDLLSKGYIPADKKSASILRRKGYLV